MTPRIISSTSIKKFAKLPALNTKSVSGFKPRYRAIALPAKSRFLAKLKILPAIVPSPAASDTAKSEKEVESVEKMLS